MARVHGRNGQLYVAIASGGVAQPLAYAMSWSADFKTDKQDVTAFGDTNKTYVAGLPDASGKFDGFYDSATAQTYTAATDGVARNFYLYPTTPTTAGPYWYGTAFFDFSVDTSVSAAVKVSGNWQAASTITKIG